MTSDGATIDPVGMTDPGSAHRIAIEPHAGVVRVSVGGRVIAESSRALCLREGAYPAVFYIPRDDARMDELTPTDHATHCPFKGAASYFSIVGGGDELVNVVWSYAAPIEAVAAIREHLAFYANKVDITVTGG